MEWDSSRSMRMYKQETAPVLAQVDMKIRGESKQPCPLDHRIEQLDGLFASDD